MTCISQPSWSTLGPTPTAHAPDASGCATPTGCTSAFAWPSRRQGGGDATSSSLQPYDPRDFGGQAAGNAPTSTAADVHAERSDAAGFLFRVDLVQGGNPVIVVQTARKPDWDYAFQNARFLLAAPPAAKPFEPSFGEGQVLRFRLHANPTLRCGKGLMKGKRVGVGRDRASILDWLSRKAGGGGFRPVIQLGDDGWDERWNIETGQVHAQKGERLRHAADLCIGQDRGAARSHRLGSFPGDNPLRHRVS